MLALPGALMRPALYLGLIMITFSKRIEQACAWIGKLSIWAMPILILATLISIVMVQLRWNTLFSWGSTIPLFGKDLTLSGLTDFQWHLFAVMTMLGGVYALRDNAHISVDVIACKFSPRTRHIITILGDLFLLLPFSFIMTYFAWRYSMSAWVSGEASSVGGLADRWIIKSIMPLGFGLLSLFGVARVLRMTLELFSSPSYIEKA